MATTTFVINGVPTLSADQAEAVRANIQRSVQNQVGSAGTVSVNRGTGSGFTKTVVAGGAAGNITVTGIATTNKLAGVTAVKDLDQSVLDLTAEFTITAANTINNTGGTATTGYHLVVTYYS